MKTLNHVWVVNFDIILILFTVEEDLTKLMERQPMVKQKAR